MTHYLYQNYYRVKERFLESIDYVEDMTKEGQAEDESLRVRRSPGESLKWTSHTREGRPTEKERVHVRRKRLIDLLAGIGVIINSVQIKKVKQSINRLQEQNILQDQKIDELARYLNLTADRVKLHDEQIYALQVEMICLHSGLCSLVVATNFHLYTYYLMNIVQLTVLKLLVGMNNLELNIDKISEYQARYKGAPSPLKGRELFHEDRMLNLIWMVLTWIPYHSCSGFASMLSISSSDFPFRTHSISWVLHWSGNMLPLGLGFWTIWCDHSSKQCQIISSSLLFCRRHMRVIPQWSLGGGSSSMNCPSWAIRDNEIHRSSLLGLTLLERVNQQSDTNKLQEGKLVAPKKVCNPGKIGEDQGIRSCLFWWWV